jgi:hypothetical protein
VIDHVERHNVGVILWRGRLVTEHARRRRRHQGDGQANAEYSAPGAMCVRPEPLEPYRHVVDVR